MPRLVYLDQNKWIQIARVVHGKETNEDLVAAVEFIKTAKQADLLGFPLSLAHYFETNRHTNAERRRRLASTMTMLSDLDTLANMNDVVRFELERALKRRFPDRVRPRDFTLVSKGIGHALGKPIGFFIQDPAGVLTDEQRTRLAAAAQAFFEFGSLAGPDVFGIEGSLRPMPAEDEKFKQILSELPDDIAHALEVGPSAGGFQDDVKIDMFLRGRCMSDLREPIEEIVAFHGLEDFTPWTEPPIPERVVEWGFLFDECPSRRVDMHLMLQFTKNPQLKRERSDLNDFVYLGIAAAYCDIVVCEKQMADLLNRTGLTKKATIISDIRDLPSI